MCSLAVAEAYESIETKRNNRVTLLMQLDAVTLDKTIEYEKFMVKHLM